MENGALKELKYQKNNYIQLPNFKMKPKIENNCAKLNNNYLSQSQNITNGNKDNPLTLSIADKIKEMKEELSKENNTYKKDNNNNDFRLRLERLSKGKFELKNNNKTKNAIKRDIDLNLMKNKIKSFEDQREKEKTTKKNALDELDNIFNNFKNNRYGN